MTLTDRFVAGAKFPTPAEAARLATLARYAALFDNDRTTLFETSKHWRRITAGTDDDGYSVAEVRDFVPYPSAKLAARTLASFLFGEDASITSDNAADGVSAIIEANHLHALNFEAALTAAADGEIFYKVDWDEEISDVAIVSAVPSSKAFPVFRFGRLFEVAFVRELPAAKDDQRLRHVEIRERGRIINRLFLGKPEELGVEVDLESNAETAGLPEELATDIADLLVRHVPFQRTRHGSHGLSIFAGGEGLIDGIHRLYSQDQHDAEMAKRRVAVPSSYLKRDKVGRPVFDRATDVLELDSEAAGPIGGDGKPITAIEFTDSTAMSDRIAQRLDEFLLACGISPESAGRDTAGAATSGTARKLAQSLTLQTVSVAGRYFKPAIRDIVRLAIIVSDKQLDRGELMPSGAGADVEPVVKVALQDGTPDDPKEGAEILASLSSAKAISTREKVRRLHPDWEEDAIAEEVERIHGDEAMLLPAMPIGGGAGGEGGDE